MRDSSLLVRHLLAFLLLVSSAPVFAAAVNDIESVPHLDASGKEAYRAFLSSHQHRAFAIAPGGTWAWKADERSIGAATETALQTCQEATEQNCVVYAADEQRVFDAKTWGTLWGPYLPRAEAARKPVGTERGKRFFDLSFKDASGKVMRLSDLRGKVLLLHFWGSWCPPCQRELPELQKLQQTLRKSPAIKMVLLQVREDIATSRKAIARQRLNLYLHDSGSKNSADDLLRLADGTTLHDRDIAAVFPTTYILDKHGIVLFSHNGPVSDWMGYLPLLQDATTRSGK
ncbi:MAG: redoxin domain-containing protein [Gallionella sp.]|nr:redoxin domain-containing protein [Gallionella sp.]